MPTNMLTENRQIFLTATKIIYWYHLIIFWHTICRFDVYLSQSSENSDSNSDSKFRTKTWLLHGYLTIFAFTGGYTRTVPENMQKWNR